MPNFDYKIECCKSADHVNVDYLSRNPLPLNDQNIHTIGDEYVFQESVLCQISTETVTTSTVKHEMALDEELFNLKENIMNESFRDPELTQHKG